MPSIASHYVVAKQVSETLNIDSDDFILGNILPDIINKTNSHYKIKGNYYLIPDINKFIENNNYNKDIFLGYLTHLFLDKYFLEEYIPNNIKNFNKIPLFTEKLIYNDYTSINYILIKKYNLEVEKITNIITKYNKDININKKINNINSLNSYEIYESKYIDLNSYLLFLDNISKRIVNDIRKWC